MRLQVRKFMHSPVVATTAKSKVSYVRELMERKNIHAIPIVKYLDKKIEIQGIITATDLRGITDETVKAQDIMNTKIHVVYADTDAKAAARIMRQHDVHHLVVMEKGKIVGMISALDFVELVANFISTEDQISYH